MFHTADLPPSLDGQPLLYLATTFSLLMINLLAIEWLWRLGWQILERPQPVKAPITSLRLSLILLLASTVIRTAPDCILMVAWHELSPHGRFRIMNFDNWADTLSFIPLSAAWLIFYLGGPMMGYQLEREPIPLHLWPTWTQMRRPVKIGLGVLALCFAFTFLRPN